MSCIIDTKRPAIGFLIDTMEINKVAFFGCSCGNKGDENFDNAFEAAQAIALSGRTIVNGGGHGVMLASTLGAKAVNGKTISVFYQPELASNFEGRSTNAAVFADKQYEEANYILRTKRLLELSDAFIVFNGGTGTISEFAMAWGIARLYIDHHKPLLLYGKFWHHLMADFKEHMLIRPEEERVYSIVNSPQELMAALDKYEAILKHSKHSTKKCKGPECSLML